MLDPKLLRSDLPGVAAALARRGFVLDVEGFAALEEQRKSVQIEADRLRAERNANAKAVGIAKSKGEDAAGLLQGERGPGGSSCRAWSSGSKPFRRNSPICSWVCPIFCTPASPTGRDESANVEVRRWGEPRRFAFEPKDHVALGEPLGMDFEAAGRISGARFVVMIGHAGQAAPRAGAIHAGPACPRSWLSRSLRALPGSRHGARRYRATAEVRAGSICRARRSGLLPDSHRRSAADQSGARSDSSRRSGCRSNSLRTRRVFVRRRGPRERIRAG